jgi:hypothetical protein
MQNMDLFIVMLLGIIRKDYLNSLKEILKRMKDLEHNSFRLEILYRT